MAHFPHSTQCTNCSTVIRAMTKEQLDCANQAHYHKKHPIIYALAQGYIGVDEDTLRFKSLVYIPKRRRKRVRKYEEKLG